MDVCITGWRTENLRGGLRNLDIDLGEKPARWTLIQMPNGMGKTTTMDLMRWTLTGKELPAATVRGLRADEHVTKGLFELRLLVDDTPIRLQLDLDFRDGSASYWTVSADTRGGGRREGRKLPVELRELLKEGLTELFVFNGELATQILDLSKTKAAEAIRSLYGLDILDAVTERVDALITQERTRASSVTRAVEQKGITQLQNALDEVKDAKKTLEKQQRAAQSRRAQVESERERIEAEMHARLSEDAGLRAQIETIDDRQGEVEKTATEYSTQALEILRRPPHVHPVLLTRLQGLGGKLYELKLPETISREFFRELSQQKLCVCGRPLGHAERKAIQEGADRFLAQDQISVINQMKLALRESKADPKELERLIAGLQEQLTERQRLKSERDRLTSERIAEGDQILARLGLEKEALVRDLSSLDDTLERLASRDPARQRALRLTWETNLPLCEAELKVRTARLDTATKTRRFSLQGEALKKLIRTTSAKSLDILRARVMASTNVKLAQIMKTENIRIARIGGGLELRSDQLATKDNASEGQKLAIAYAFLTSLLAEAPYRLPFVVDSPAVSIDVASRREIARLIPDFFGQMIMFVISSERAGFAESFYSRSAAVNYLTIMPLGGGTADIQYGLQAFQEFHGPESVA
ncbi:AAA family ATPase [Sphingomonas sp. MMS12-HWE2-04]|uniref:AAA family ATPase n=1 Tax=Sphingomonas sp. MMS12-HWE2-04 TaxID=3234199 RepID=UPI0038505E9F